METNIYLIVFVNTTYSLPTRKKKLNDIVLLTLLQNQSRINEIHCERDLTGISRFASVEYYTTWFILSFHIDTVTVRLEYFVL